MITFDEAQEIKAAYDAALENECTCYSCPDSSCRFCNLWTKAEGLVEKLVEDGA